MSHVAIVTDSTSYIPSEMSREYPIFSVPLQVIWGEETFLDGVTIKVTDFYERLKTAKVMPTTSQPTPAAFIEIYKELIEKGYDVLSVHISSKLSGTVDSAVQAKAMLQTNRVEIIDSESTTMALGFQVMTVARAAKQGATLVDCKTIAEEALKHTGAIFVVNTLEFLHRGGRIGGGAAFLGTALDLKPILELRNGKIEAVERVRSMNKAVDRLINLFVKKANSSNIVRIAAVHGNSAEAARDLLAKTVLNFSVNQVQDALISDVSPVIGTHTGPGVLGIAYMVGM